MTPRHLTDFRYILECVYVSVCVFVRLCCVWPAAPGRWSGNFAFKDNTTTVATAASVYNVMPPRPAHPCPIPNHPQPQVPSSFSALQKTLDILFILLRPLTHKGTHSLICPGRQGRPLVLHTYICNPKVPTDLKERARFFPFSIACCSQSQLVYSYNWSTTTLRTDIV